MRALLCFYICFTSHCETKQLSNARLRYTPPSSQLRNAKQRIDNALCANCQFAHTWKNAHDTNATKSAPRNTHTTQQTRKHANTHTHTSKRNTQTRTPAGNTTKQNTQAHTQTGHKRTNTKQFGTKFELRKITLEIESTYWSQSRRKKAIPIRHAKPSNITQSTLQRRLERLHALFVNHCLRQQIVHNNQTK
jgi:hypothetical protein